MSRPDIHFDPAGPPSSPSKNCEAEQKVEIQMFMNNAHRSPPQADRRLDKRTYIHACMHAWVHTYVHAHIQVDRQADRQTGGQTDGQKLPSFKQTLTKYLAVLIILLNRNK